MRGEEGEEEGVVMRRAEGAVDKEDRMTESLAVGGDG